VTRALFFVLTGAALAPGVPAWAALLVGVAFGVSAAPPFAPQVKRASTWLLQGSVVGLGAAMNLEVVLAVGARGLGLTLVSIAVTLLAGLGLSRALGVERVSALLISVGTAICGGSAIAAVAPVVGAKSHQVSVSLAVVFLLNAFALVVFPPLGHALALSGADFGLWSALAIHDTSSVVGASMQFGAGALEVATPVKLARALWVAPLTVVAARVTRPQEARRAGPRPWFIVGFVAAAALVTWVPGLAAVGEGVAAVARRLLVLTLFLVGSGVTRAALREAGWRPLVLGAVLWVLVGVSSLAVVRLGLMP
jgi:uncharacterized integral membrane protein (TIGR00698 family)